MRRTSTLLYEVKPGDQTIFAASVLVLTAAAALAGYLPALHASRVDPVIALRRE